MLLRAVGLDATILPVDLPERFFEHISSASLGEAAEWSPTDDPEVVIGFTSYALGSEHWMIVMREVSEKRLMLARSLHRQRLENAGKLVASIVHDLRAPLSSIAYNVETLTAGRKLSDVDTQAVVSDIRVACRRLKRTIDGLLDYARIGPQVCVDVSLHETLSRVASFVRSLLRDGGHSLCVHIDPDAGWVRGNSIVLEQIFVNLIINATEACSHPTRIEITASPEVASEDGRARVRVSVVDDGPGIPRALHRRVFEPFFTTKPKGTGLGLTTSYQAVKELDGEMWITPTPLGAHLAVVLPAGTPRASEAGEESP